MSVRGLERLIKLAYSAEEQRARAEDGGGIDDGVEGVSMVTLVRRIRLGVAGWVDCARRWRRSTSTVVAVVAVLCAGR